MKQANESASTQVTSVPKQYYSASTSKIKMKKEISKRQNKSKSIIAGTIAAILFATAAYSAFAANFSLGYTVTVDNTVVGKVAAKSEYYEVLDEVKTEVKDTADAEFSPKGEESFQAAIVKKDELTEKDQLAENLKSTDDNMIEVFKVTYDGELLATLATEEEANSALERYLSLFREENVTAEFAKETVVLPSFALSDAIQTEEAFYHTLLAGKSITHTVQNHETLKEIATHYGVSEEALAADNELQKNKVADGMTLTVYTGEPLLSVKTVTHLQGEFEIPFETASNEDNTLYEGTIRVDKKGETGLKYMDAYITKIDGVETDKTVLAEEVKKEPVTQIQRTGTKERPAEIGTGSFITPTTGKFTSPFGPRWGRMHSGIDIAAKVGTPIYASDNGIVTLSQYKNNGYGNLIVIDHGNGFETYYAHCSALLAKEGDVVAKGDLIAKMGSTGRSTGSHLHFEVRENGVAKNPTNYINIK